MGDNDQGVLVDRPIDEVLTRGNHGLRVASRPRKIDVVGFGRVVEKVSHVVGDLSKGFQADKDVAGGFARCVDGRDAWRDLVGIFDQVKQPVRLQDRDVEVEVGLTVRPFRNGASVGAMHDVFRVPVDGDTGSVALDRRTHDVVCVNVGVDDVRHVVGSYAKSVQSLEQR